MVPDGRYLHGNGASFLLRGNELEKVRTWERVGQPDGFPYFGDRAGSLLVVPGNPEPSALVFLNDLLFEEWR